MSVVKLDKVTIYGLLIEKEDVMEHLQRLGCMHLIPLSSYDEDAKTENSNPKAWEALKFLLSSPQKRRQVSDPKNFEAETVMNRALEIQDSILKLGDERDFLNRRITDLKPWGEFSYPPLEELGNLRLWFYLVPHNDLKKVEETDHIWEVVKKDERFDYVAVVSKEEPQGMPAPRTHSGSVPLPELEQRLEEVELELEDLQAERVSLTRWCGLFARNMDRFEDSAELAIATRGTLDEEPLFAVQGWVPLEDTERLLKYSNNNGLATIVEEPSHEDEPPTMLHNPPELSSGESLVTFYQTPSYWAPDPSTPFFFSFIIFFAMILGDTGYGLVLGLILLLIWKRMGRSSSRQRMRILLTCLVGATIIWGILVGSYFGASPPEGSLLAKFKILDLGQYDVMMKISIIIGATHVIIANIIKARNIGYNLKSMIPIGWASIISGGLVFGLSGGLSTAPGIIGLVMFILGVVLVLVFNGLGTSGYMRILLGFKGLAGISGAFGDVLSYLRLFALGLATSSLALAFNDLSSQVADSVPGLGLLLSLIVLIIGHGLNLALGIMSGVVHGLRLNMIEFLKWSNPDEGYLFRPFAKKEESKWTK